MTETRSATGPEVSHYRELYRACAGRLPGHGVGWLDRARDEAMARFEAVGFPTPRDEAWKYTNVAPIARRPFQALLAGSEPEAPAAADDTVKRAVHGVSELAAQRLVFVNGVFCAPLSAGVPTWARSLRAVLEESPELVAPHLDPARAGQVADGAGAGNGFRALNAALASDGAYLHVSAVGDGEEQTIELVFVSAGATELATHVRNVVVVAAGARARLVETYVSADAARQLTNAHTDVHLGPGASLEHFRLQLESDQAYQVAAVDVSQAEDSRYVSHALSFGGRLSRCDINAGLRGAGGACTLNGLYLVTGRQHVDFHTRVDHLAPRCTSRELYKGILDGRARGVFNGAVIVHPGAQGTDATQANHNLLLSRDAEIDTKPQLEIFADDVKCSHGATVGQLDESMLFYLRSRGLDEASARATLTYGFADGVLEEMSLPAARRLITARLGRLLPAALQASPPDDLPELLATMEASA